MKRNMILKSSLVAFFLLFTFTSISSAAPGTWKKDWDDAKDEYEELSGKKKPSESVLKFFKKRTGLDGSLGNADTAMKALQKNPTQKTLDTFTDKVKTFSKNRKSYMKTLKKSLDTANDTDKQLLTTLKQELKAIEGSMRSQIKMFTKTVAGEGTGAAIKAGMFDGLKGTLAKAKKFAARLNSEKDMAKKVELFSKNYNKVSRDITQNMGNIIKIDQKGKTEESFGAEWKGSLPEGAYEDLQKWSNAKSGLDINEENVDAELDDFMTAVMSIDSWAKKQK